MIQNCPMRDSFLHSVSSYVVCQKAIFPEGTALKRHSNLKTDNAEYQNVLQRHTCCHNLRVNFALGN